MNLMRLPQSDNGGKWKVDIGDDERKAISHYSYFHQRLFCQHMGTTIVPANKVV